MLTITYKVEVKRSLDKDKPSMNADLCLPQLRDGLNQWHVWSEVTGLLHARSLKTRLIKVGYETRILKNTLLIVRKSVECF